MKKLARVIVLLCLVASCCGVRVWADEYDTLRLKWKTMLTGGTAYNPGDPDIQAALLNLNTVANDYWTAMDKSPTRTYLWSDLPPTSSARLTANYGRLRTLALAYNTHGSSLKGNATLAADIVGAMEYLNINFYNTTRPTPPSSGSSNWWDWQLGIPQNLNDATVLMYDVLTPTQITNYMAAVHRYTHTVGMSGANRTWQATIIGVRGVIVKDSERIATARDGLSAIFLYRTSGDGFYIDGSFVQHRYFAYNGGYGVSLLSDTADLLNLLEGSTWTVVDPNKANFFEFVYDSFQPLIYKGAMMDMVRGREIARHYSQDHVEGHAAMQAIIRVAQFAPPADTLAFKRMIKYWIGKDTFSSFYSDAPVGMVALAKAIMSDSSITPAPELIKYQQLSGSDRAVFLRPGFGLGLAMFSTRIGPYESINSENGRGWYTGAGTTYLYNNDLGHFSGDFWPTVDSKRLPGTTVTSPASGSLPDITTATVGLSPWVGGTALLDTYGVSGMQLSYSTSSLTAKKSWFMFDDEIVALGAGITSTDSLTIETVIENRKIDGANAFVANGVTQPNSLGWNATLSAVNWMHLAGSVPGSDIGYYLPIASAVKAKREARVGNWASLRKGSPETEITRNYLTLWLDHGINPSNTTYQYVLLPNFSPAQVSAYSTNPEISVVENSANAQAVKETSLGILGVNFWADGAKTVGIVTVDKKSSVMLRENEGSIDFAISDPTMLNTSVINVEIARAATAVTSVSSGVTVTQLSPTIKLTVNVSGAKGAALRAKFAVPATVVTVDNRAAAAVGGWKVNNAQTDRYGQDYLHDDNTGKGSKSVTFRPNLPVAGNYRVSMMWSRHDNRATNVPVEILHSSATTTMTVKQTENGGVWNPLGMYTFAAGTAGTVKIKNDNTDGFVVADAVQFELVQ